MAKPSKQPRIKGRFAPKPKEQPDRIKQIELDVNRHGVALITAVDRIEGYLNKVGQAVIDQGREFKSRLNRIESSVAERLDALRMEQYALAQDTPIDPLMNNGIVEPQSASLQPGDYCDASKEVADELTAMGWKWHDSDKAEHKYIRFGQAAAIGKMINIPSATNMAHLDALTFLSRARVTAKELGLKPVEAPAEEPWRPRVGELAMYTDNDFITLKAGDIITVTSVDPDGMISFRVNRIELNALPGQYRKPSEAEIAAHLAAEEAKRKEAERAQKVKALGFGVRVRTAYGEGIYQMEDEHGAHVVVHPDTTGYHGIDQITIL
jgi:hypothetical protein